MNPLARLSPALYTALTGLAYAGVAVPVYQHVPEKAPLYYVVLHEPKIGQATGRLTCRQWPCSVTVEVITRFATDAVSSVPADAIADLVLARLDGRSLPLIGGWQAMEGQLAAGDGEGEPTDGDYRLVRRRLTLRWVLFNHGQQVSPVPPVLLNQGFDYAFIGGAFALTS